MSGVGWRLREKSWEMGISAALRGFAVTGAEEVATPRSMWQIEAGGSKVVRTLSWEREGGRESGS